MAGEGFGYYLNILVDTMASQGLLGCRDRTDAVIAISEAVNRGDATIYKWLNGSAMPVKSINLEPLAKLGRDGGLPRSWGEGFLRTGGHRAADGALKAIWGEAELRLIPCNLPEALQSRFIGRDRQIEKLLEKLSPDLGASIITVDGPGGVGKTAMVLQVAHMCWRASEGRAADPKIPVFDSIIFVSAKQQRLEDTGIVRIRYASKTFQSIFSAIASVLHLPKINLANPRAQREMARAALNDYEARPRGTLLIIDNFETITRKEREKVLGLLDHLWSRVKVIITTREKAQHSFVRVPPLTETESMTLLARLARDREADAESGGRIGEPEMRAIYKKVGGIPAAMQYVVGQVAAGHPLDGVLAGIGNPRKDVARFCFESSARSLRNTPAHRLLTSAAMFAPAPTAEAAAIVAELSPADMNDAVAELISRLLITDRNGRYEMNPLTREYALYELGADSAFEAAARERWVNWYLRHMQRWGGLDWADWSARYRHIEEEWANYLEVFEWCAAHEKIREMSRFWSDEGIEEFSSIREHWDSRLFWLTWLQEAALKHGGRMLLAAIRAMNNKAWTLILMGQPEDVRDAKELLTRAWGMRDKASPLTRNEIAHNFSVLCVRTEQYGKFHGWYNEQKKLLGQITRVEPRRLKREELNMNYWFGTYLFNTGDYEAARRTFVDLLEVADDIGWDRAVNYIHNWLADIEIALEQDLHYAEKLLVEGLPIAESAGDLRRTAHYYHSLALLKKQQGEEELACSYGRTALDRFERRGMLKESGELEELLREWNCGPGDMM
jgi:hypothetical protein